MNIKFLGYRFPKQIPVICFAIIISIFNISSGFAATFSSKANGNWNSASTWNITSGSDPDGIPDVSDNVRINSAHTVSLTANADCNTITLYGSSGNQAQLAIGTFTFTVAASVSISGGLNSVITIGNNGIFNIGGNFPSGATFSAGTNSIVNFTNLGTQNVGAYTYSNLAISGSNTKTLLGNTTVQIGLTVNSGCTLALGLYSITTQAVNLECGATTGSVISGSGSLTPGNSITVTDAAIAGTSGATISCPVSLNANCIIDLSDDGSTAADLTISGNISGAFGITKSGLGTLKLSGASTFSGNLTLIDGIFQQGAANVIGNIPIIFNGGTYSTGATTGYSETTGTIALTDNSTIALGTGTHTLTFANSNSVSWSSALLTITGWTGSYNGTTAGTNPKIIIGNNATALTADQLSKIIFINPTTGAIHLATLLSTGELVALATQATITTGTIIGSPFCQLATNINIPFTYSPVSCFTSGSTVFSAQLSDGSGSFSSPFILQTINSDGSGNQSMIASLPTTLPIGTGYRIRVVSNIPVIAGANNGTNLLVNLSPVTPAGTIVPASCPGNNGSITLNNTPSSLAFVPADNDYVDLSTSFLSNLSQFTMEGWIKFNPANAVARMSIFGQNDAIEFGFVDASNLQCWTSGGGSVNMPLTSYPSGNDWHHIAMIGNGTNLLFYIDGVLKATGGSTTTNYGSSTYSAKIGGACFDPTGGTFNGQIIKVGFYNTALSQNAVKSLASGFTNYTGSETGILAGYNFSEGTGSTLAKVGTGGSNGTFVNTPAWTEVYTFAWTNSEIPSFASSNRNISALAAGQYNLTLTLGACTTTSSWVVPTTTLKTWNGSTSVNWNTASNWTPSGVPGVCSDVTIPSAAITNFPIISTTGATCANLNILSGASLTIDYNGQLTVNSHLTNQNSVAGLLIKSTSGGSGSLLHSTSNVEATIERYVTGSAILTQYYYHQVSIPLVPESNSIAAIFTDSYLFNFIESASLWNGLGGSLYTPLDETRGYLIYYPGPNTTYSFSGQMNNNTFTTLTTYTAGYGYNLVPNPYPSAIDWDAASGWTKTNIANSIYLWKQSAGNYSSYINGSGTNGGTRYIPVGQAFFVKAVGASPVLKMNNLVRCHNTTAFTKSNLAFDANLTIHADGNGFSDETVVRFLPNATEDYDPEYDAIKMAGNANAPQLYTMSHDNQKLSINSLNYSASEITVPLDFTLETSCPITFTASGMESFYGDVSIYLEDILDNKLINLSSQPVYTFSHTNTNSADRFRLHFYGVTSTKENPEENLILFTNQGNICIDSPGSYGKNATIKIYNTIGQQIAEKQTKLDGVVKIASPETAGIYVVQLVVGNQIFSGKIVIP